MIIHIAHESEYSFKFYRLLVENFNPDEHQFILIKKSSLDDNCEFNYEKAIRIKNFRNNPYVREKLYSCKAIILHGLFFRNIIRFLFLNSDLLKKTSWLIWGGDLYFFKEETAKFSSYSKNGIDLRLIKEVTENLFSSMLLKKIPFGESSLEMQRRHIIKKLNSIICLAKGDFEVAKRVYGTSARYLHGFYPIIIDFQRLDSLRHNMKLLETTKDESLIKILVGNSSTCTNRHIEAFESIVHFKNENFQVVCPLSYGDHLYREEVIKIGKEFFGDKFIPITQVQSNQEYLRFLSTIDVAIMNHDRQQGLGTILSLLLLGKKIFIREGITSFSLLTDLGIKTFSTDEILHHTDIRNLCKMDDFYGIKNYQIVKENFSEERWVAQWKMVFEEISNLL